LQLDDVSVASHSLGSIGFHGIEAQRFVHIIGPPYLAARAWLRLAPNRPRVVTRLSLAQPATHLEMVADASSAGFKADETNLAFEVHAK